MPTCTICSESFPNIEEYLKHANSHAAESKRAAVRTCKTCSVTSCNFDKYKRICRSCIANCLHRCTSCNKVKHASAFHKGNTSGRCAACKRTTSPDRDGEDVIEIRKNAGLSSLTDEAKEDIAKMLAEIQEYYDSDGERGKKHKYTAICRKHNIKEPSLQYWMRNGIFQRPERVKRSSDEDSE